jgi:hypothetical protein
VTGRRAARVLRLAGATALAGCATLAAPGGPWAVGGGRGEDVVVLRAHTHVLGVAASARHVYALTTGGLVTWDRVFGRWVEPSAWLTDELRAAGVGEAFGPVGPAVLAADPVEEAVWLGIPGAVVVVRPRQSQALRVTVAGQVELIAFARDGGAAWVLASGRWLRVSRAGFVSAASPPEAGALVLPADLEAVYRAHPALRASLPFLLRDEATGGVSARVRTGTLSPDRPGEAWIGTWGDGLWVVDARFLSARSLPIGLPADDVQAVWASGDGVWVAVGRSDGQLRVAQVAAGAARDAGGEPGVGGGPGAGGVGGGPGAGGVGDALPRGLIRAVRDSVVVLARGPSVRWSAPGVDERPLMLPGAALAEVGPVVALALDAERVWIAGARGVFHVARAAAFAGVGGSVVPDVSRPLTVGRELPAPIQALAVAPPYAWVGTRAGLVRVRLTAEGTIP